jgi:hypothetical protein
MTKKLTGTLPVRAFHPDGFFGTLQMDGQHPRVAAIACHQLDVVVLSLVGYDTSVSAVLAKLWLREAVPFLPAEAVDWQSPRRLERRVEGYKQFSTKLAGTKEVHCIALPLSAHLAEGILHPPDLPKPQEDEDTQRAAKASIEPTPVDRTRFVLGNWDEPTPHQRSFLGQLHAMRVIFLHRHHHHPQWVDTWASELWSRGLTRHLIVPLKALGIKAWMLSGDLVAWGQLIRDGVCEGWLPWREGTASLAQEYAANEHVAVLR